MNTLEIKNVTYSYANSKEKVLSLINQSFELGKFYAIIGKSGTGKSTLLSLMAGLDKPNSGEILFNNENIVIPISVAFVIAMIANDIPIGGVLVAEAITLGFRFGMGGFGIYIVEILMFVLSIFILKPIEIKMDSEKYKLGKRVVIITIITSMLMYMKKYPFYAVCEFTIFSLCLEYIFYKIFYFASIFLNSL